ncbi:MAG TPA: DinB family protein [Gemmatimonadaceae bacterium]|nr:DinB family protein [Gemmatimonadaceae bacterium]
MSEPEVWLRGPIDGIAPLLQPVAHSLLQCRLEVRATLPTLTPADVWARPGGAASAGYHVRHAIGSLDRLLTYARGEQLSESQLAALRGERRADERDGIPDVLVAEFDAAVERALAQVRATDPATLLEPREVGRGRLPSTVLGLLFHAAEHTQRHIGQLVTTAKLLHSPPVSG